MNTMMNSPEEVAQELADLAALRSDARVVDAYSDFGSYKSIVIEWYVWLSPGYTVDGHPTFHALSVKECLAKLEQAKYTGQLEQEAV